MNEKKSERIIKIIKIIAAEFMQKKSNGTALITITNVKFSNDEKCANVLFTVLPENKEDAVLEFAKRIRTEFRQYIKKHSKLGRIPIFDFQIDLGEKHRQKIDKIAL
ncbi:MAG: ribosome-binding factor A [bacterium]